MRTHKLIRITTVPMSLQYLIKGQPSFMSDFFEVICVSSGPKEELEKVSVNEQVKIKEVYMTRQITPMKDLLSLVKLIRLFRKEKPTIVHTHTPKAGILGMLASRLTCVPIRLHTVAGMPLMESTGIKRKILDIVEKLTYYFATKVYPNSEGLEYFILKNNYAVKEKIKVIANGSSNGIDTSYFDPAHYSKKQRQNLRQRIGIQEDDFVFIYVGRLVADKGINELVKAFSLNSNYTKKSLLLGKEFSEKLLLVGSEESELDPLSQETLEEIKNNPSIISTGFQADVRPYFAISDALIFPSYREGFPNVVMQAGAMGLPSIVSDINGCNEIIIDGKNGIIIPVKNVEAIVEAMQKIYNDKDFYIKLKQNTRSLIISRYEQSVVWKALLEEYNHLINQMKL